MALLLTLALVAVLALLLSSKENTVASPEAKASVSVTASPTASPQLDLVSMFDTAYQGCQSKNEADTIAHTGKVTLTSDGSTLKVDGLPASEVELGVLDESLITAAQSCVGNRLAAPSSFIERLKQTRGLDGTQEAAWDGITATWTYHPENGLDVIFSID